jgi:hypothetical protein
MKKGRRRRRTSYFEGLELILLRRSLDPSHTRPPRYYPLYTTPRPLTALVLPRPSSDLQATLLTSCSTSPPPPLTTARTGTSPGTPPPPPWPAGWLARLLTLWLARWVGSRPALRRSASRSQTLMHPQTTLATFASLIASRPPASARACAAHARSFLPMLASACASRVGLDISTRGGEMVAIRIDASALERRLRVAPGKVKRVARNALNDSAK